MNTPTTYTEAELEALLAPNSIGDKRSRVYRRDRMLVELLAGTGMRINEVLGLTRIEIDLERLVIYIPPERDKTGRGRYVYFGPTLAEKLRAYLAWLPALENRLFTTSSRAPLTDTHVRGLMKKIARRAGVDPKRVHAHAFRHSYAFRYVEAGGDVYMLQQQLGHKSLSTTSIYLQAASRRRAEQVARLDL